jgi:hypothetical protein
MPIEAALHREDRGGVPNKVATSCLPSFRIGDI